MVGRSEERRMERRYMVVHLMLEREDLQLQLGEQRRDGDGDGGEVRLMMLMRSGVVESSARRSFLPG